MMVRVSLLCVPALLALTACPAPKEEEDTCLVADTPTCEEPLVASCRDDTFTTLSMNLREVAPGAIDSVADGSGFEVSVDATASAPPGSLDAPDGWVYGKFTDDGLVKVDLLDDEAFDSTDWDIAFRRFVVRLNSGYSGPGCVSAANIGAKDTFDEVSCVPEGATFNIEDAFLSDPDTCTLVPDGSGLGSAGVVLQNWWHYPRGCVATTGNIYLISTGDGRLVKFEMTQYYQDAQPACNDDDSIEGASAHVKARFAFLE